MFQGKNAHVARFATSLGFHLQMTLGRHSLKTTSTTIGATATGITTTRMPKGMLYSTAQWVGQLAVVSYPWVNLGPATVVDVGDGVGEILLDLVKYKFVNLYSRITHSAIIETFSGPGSRDSGQ
jgi:hypothetical protein